MLEPMNLLVTLDRNYLVALRPMLMSAFASNPGETFRVHLIHDDIDDGALAGLRRFCAYHGSELAAIRADSAWFRDAPVSRYLTRAMYYRLLAFEVLPSNLDRVLYMDPDTLVINPLRPLYGMDLGDHLFAAAAHSCAGGFVEPLNMARLGMKEAEGYYNSGVLLYNLACQRRDMGRKQIEDYIEANKYALILPDQDLLNGLYGARILPLDDSLYNYDAHRYDTYRMMSGGEKDQDWVMDNTVILHFCGKRKPWIDSSRSRFGVLFRHYMALADRTEAVIAEGGEGDVAKDPSAVVSS